mgnify:CR=1 FL=1
MQGRPGEGEVRLSQCLAEARVRVDQFLHVVGGGLPTHHQGTLRYQFRDVLSHEVHTDERLREIHCGSWHGRSIDEVSQEFPQLVKFRRSGQDFRRSDTGETAAEVADRVCEALFEIIKDNKNQTVMIVSHGLAIRVGIARLLGLPDELSTKLGTLQNCRYALVSHSKRRVRLSAYNLPG